MKEFYIDHKDIKLHAKLSIPETEMEKSAAGNSEVSSLKLSENLNAGGSAQALPLVIIVHGLTGDMEENQLLCVERAALHCQMASLRLEMFGHGLSGGDFAEHTVSKWVEEIIYVVDKIISGGRIYNFSDIYLCGHSQGGLASILAAAGLKGKIKSLILLSPATCIVTDARCGNFFGEHFDEKHPPKKLTFWENYTLNGSYLEDAENLPLENAISSYTEPVLIVHGTEDEAVPFEDSQKLVEIYENAALVPVENDLHCFDRHPEELKEAVEDFLKIMDRSVSVETMRRSDAWTIENLIPSKELMYRAGKGIYEAADWKSPVAIVCGKGNNAGDGYVVAKLLKENNIDCEMILLADDFSEDGRYYYELARSSGVVWKKYSEDVDFFGYGSILDCIFGTGFKGEVHGTAKEVIEKINSSGAYVVSADINSGLNGDTGRGSCCVKSDLTVSIGSYKYGHFLGRGDEVMKDKVNVDIGIRII